MAKNSIYDYSTTASSNTDIAGIGILGTNAVSNFDDAFRTIMAQIATDVSPRRFAIQGALYGLTLSNNASDAANDIDIAVGMATSDSTTDPRTMVLASALTKRLDAAWAVGSGNGGLDTGSIANTTYHVWLIQRSDTGVVDALFSTSATSPTMPSNYDRKRRIGSIMRASGAIRLFVQNGDYFKHVAGLIDQSSIVPAGSTLQTMTVPLGISVGVLTAVDVGANASTGVAYGLGDAAVGNVQTAVFSINHANAGPIRLRHDIGTPYFSNTSAQIYRSLGISFGSITVADLYCLGWIDTRGRLS